MDREQSERARRAAAELDRQHREREHFRSLPDELRPRDLDEAYAAQAALNAIDLARPGRVIGGRKVALTSQVMQKMLGVDHPNGGVIYSDRIHGSGVSLPHGDFVHIGVESEIAVQLRADLPAAAAPHDAASVAGAVLALMPAIEIVDDRNADYSVPDIFTGIADNSWNGGCVLGPWTTDWRALDLEAIAGHMVINGETVGSGVGADVLGHPLNSLAWLANHLNRRDERLRAGDVVMTGSVVATHWLEPGDEMRTVFDDLGEAVLHVV